MLAELKPYPQMRDSGVEWLGEVPAHWDVSALRHRYSQCLGKMLDTAKIKGKHLVPYLRNVDVQWDRINVNDLPAMDIAPAEYERYTVRQGDLLVCEGGEVGRSAIWGSKLEICGFQKALHRLRPHDARRDSVRYLYHALRVAVQREAFNDGHQSTIAHLTGEKLRVHRFPFPPTSEQTAIAHFLDHATDRIERYIRAKEKLIALLEEQKQVAIHNAVTGRIDVRTARPYATYKPSSVEWLGNVPAHWNVSALRHRYSQCLGKMLDTSKIKGNNLVPYLRNIDVQWDQINVRGLPAMDIAPDEYERYTVQRGDLIVCEGGEVGRCAIWESKLEVCGFQKALHRLRPLDARRDLVRYLYHALRVAVQREAFKDGHQSTIAHLTGEKLRVHRFPFPPTSEQEAIVSFLDAAVAQSDRSLDDIRRQIKLLREYRTRLIADVVTGKLDVREAAAELPDMNATVYGNGIDTMQAGTNSRMPERGIAEEANA